MGMEQGSYMEGEHYVTDVLDFGGGGGGVAVDDSSFYDGGFFDGGGISYIEPIADSFIEGEIPFAPYEPVPLEPPVFEPLPVFEPIADQFFELPYLPYDPVPLEPPVLEPLPVFPDLPFFGGPSFEEIPLTPAPPLTSFWEGAGQEQAGGDDLWGQAYENWLGVGLDADTAAAYADLDLEAIKESQGVISIPYSEAETPTPELPDFPYFELPYISQPFDWLQPPPIIPFEEPPAPPPPKLPPYCDTPTGLPPYCPQGTGRGPLGSDPCLCYPLPAPQQPPRPPPQQQQPRPPQPPQPPRPPQQPPCPTTTHWVNPQTRRCEPKPKCPTGSVFDARAGKCVLPSQLTQPQPDGAALDSKDDWWMWLLLAGGAAWVLSDGGSSSGSSSGSSGGRRRR